MQDHDAALSLKLYKSLLEANGVADCSGTLLSRQQYLVDVQEWGFRDARLEQRAQMNEKDIADWTDAIQKEQRLPSVVACAVLITLPLLIR